MTPVEAERLTNDGRSPQRPWRLQGARGLGSYRGDGPFLRLGPGLEAELCAHRQLLAYDFPVPRILEVGAHEGSTYVVEESLGQGTLGDRFVAELDANGVVSDASFSVFLYVVSRYARAQAAMVATSAAAVPGDVELVVGVTAAAALVPELSEQIRSAFDSAATGARHSSPVLVRGPEGYDVVTAAFVPMLCDTSTAVGGAPERQWFSHTQISD